MVQIEESGMVFGNYPEEKVFKLENSQTHKAVGEGVRSVEFLYLLKEDMLAFVEAKSSSPRKETSMERYNEFINEIMEKFVHSFDMYVASKVGRYDELSGLVASSDAAELRYRFVLVINGHKPSWLLPLKEELNRKLLYHRKIWKSDVIVMNDEVARGKGLIL